jgi:2-aminobenzoate-CoA ligase
MDEDGYFFYQARTDDMIISAGYNIAGPRSKARCSRTRRSPNARWSAGPTRSAARSSRPSSSSRRTRPAATCRELQDHVKRASRPYKYPRAIEFVDALPRTETGKCSASS